MGKGTQSPSKRANLQRTYHLQCYSAPLLCAVRDFGVNCIERQDGSVLVLLCDLTMLLILRWFCLGFGSRLRRLINCAVPRRRPPSSSSPLPSPPSPSLAWTRRLSAFTALETRKALVRGQIAASRRGIGHQRPRGPRCALLGS